MIIDLLLFMAGVTAGALVALLAWLLAWLWRR